MRLTGSGVYSRPPPVPRMPAGLVELMENITKDVLRHNPPNVYEFCANHMAKLLEIRDGRAPKKILTLEQKIAKAQQIIRERAENRRQKYDEELLIQSNKDAVKSFDDANQTVQETTLENVPKAPIHHEQDLAEALEVEIFHKLNDEIDPRNKEYEMSSKREEEIIFEVKEEDLFKEITDIDMFKEPSVALESTVLKQQLGNSFRAILTEADEVFGNTKQSVSEHTRNRRSIGPIEENIDYDEDLCNSEVEQIIDVQKEIKNIVDGVDLQVRNAIDDSIEKPEDIIDISKAISDKIVDTTIDKDEIFVNCIDGNINKNLDVTDKNMDNIVDKTGNAVNSTANRVDNLIESNGDEADEAVDLSVQNINSTVEATEAIVDNIINTTENKISTIVEPIDENVGSIVDKVTETIDIIVDSTIENVDNIADVPENEINIITDNIDNVLDANKEKVKHDLGTTTEKVENITDTTGETIDNIVDESMKNVNNVVDATENVLDIVNATEIKTVKKISTAAENKLETGDSIEEKVKNVTNTIIENIDTIVNANANEEVDKNNLYTTEEKVANVVNTAEKNINDVVQTIKENANIPEVSTSQIIDNVKNTAVEKVEDVITITGEKVNIDTNMFDEKVDNTNSAEQTAKDIVDVDREHAENTMNTDDENVENSVNITENEAENIVSAREAIVENNENKVKNIEYETNKKVDSIVSTTTKKDGNIFNVSKETTKELVNAIDEKVEKVPEIKSVEKNNFSENGTDKLKNNEHGDPGENDKIPITEKVSNTALKSSETSFEDKKEPHVLPEGLIAQISNITVPTVLKDIADESHSYVESMEEQCITSNVIELTVVGNGNNDNYAVNEMTNQENSNTELDRSALTPEPNINLNENSSDLPLSKRDEGNSDTVENVSNIYEPEQLDIDINSIGKHSSMDDSTIGDSHDSILELDAIKNMDETLQNIHSPNTMDLETAAVTIQKVFRTFLFKSRGSTFDDTVNDETNLIDDDNEKEDEEFPIASSNLTKERRALGITRMDTVLQTVNEEKSLSLSTDDSSTLSSAATTIQAHVRGFLVRNKLNFNKTISSTSLVNSDGTQSLEVDVDQQKNNKTVLNIHIVPEGEHFLSRDESMLTSMDLSLDGSPPSSTNLHPLGYNKNERRKQLKREDAIQSMSPPSNNSGKLSEEMDSVKDILINDTLEQQSTVGLPADNEPHPDTSAGSGDASPTKSTSTTMETVIETRKYYEVTANSPDLEKDNSAADKRKRLTKMNSDEADVVTPFVSNEDKESLPDSDNTLKLLHSGEFHDIVLPTKVSRTDTSVVREFKHVLVYFLKWNNS